MTHGNGTSPSDAVEDPCLVDQVVPLNQAREFSNNKRAIYVFKVNSLGDLMVKRGIWTDLVTK
jgi:hypothetical protein